MIFFDVNNGIARRSWAKNANALLAINKEMKKTPKLKVTIPENVNNSILDSLF
jgi:urocanate hydratase